LLDYSWKSPNAQLRQCQLVSEADDAFLIFTLTTHLAELEHHVAAWSGFLASFRWRHHENSAPLATAPRQRMAAGQPSSFYVFALHRPSSELRIFPGNAEAVAFVKPREVAEGRWKFFSENGGRLEPEFTSAGEFRLEPFDYPIDLLIDNLDLARLVESLPPYDSIESIRAHLAQSSHSVGAA
jgi:hypothetical protein